MKKQARRAPSRAAVMPPPSRVVIGKVEPEVEGGRFPIKRSVGEHVHVNARIFADGHEELSAVVRYRHLDEEEWHEAALEALGNDRWRSGFRVTELGEYVYTVQAWVDRFKTWNHDLKKRLDAGQDVSVEILVGADLVAKAAGRAPAKDAARLNDAATLLRSKANTDTAAAAAHALDPGLAALMEKYSDRSLGATHERELKVVVDRERARFSAWYEMFPRASSPQPGRHGTFRDCIAMLPYVAEMGFDVFYLPPIHPIGTTNRKGKNNNPNNSKGDVGSPWAIGSPEGGHKAIHPQLGTLEDFRALVDATRSHGMEIALDIAFQCTPDHPYVKEHPEWFVWRPDGTVQYAENPPKKYQDIYPLNFESEGWRDLWEELRSVVEYWIEQGVNIFRVDNPHTKPFSFWEWMITEIRQERPEVIFLSEAFTRPEVMYRLAKLGFNQSYTYFAWRNTSWELSEYLTELTRTEVREYFRPNFWPNTPDILTEYLQTGGRPAFMTRLVLAATLCASYGIYGPAFELCENRPLRLGSEEYLDAEKYEIREWDRERADSLRPLITRVNQVRRENPALQANDGLTFHPVDNQQILAYSKATEDLSNIILVVVSLDPHHTQSGWLELPLEQLGMDAHQPFQVHDLLDDARYIWNGPRNYVELNPHKLPAHIFKVRRRVRTERDFDYFL